MMVEVIDKTTFDIPKRKGVSKIKDKTIRQLWISYRLCKRCGQSYAFGTYQSHCREMHVK